MNPDGDKHNNKSEETAFSKLLSIRYLGDARFNGIGSNGSATSLAGCTVVSCIDNELEQHEEIKKEEEDEWRKITQQEEQLLNISGVAKNIELGNSSDTSVKSFYLNEGNVTDKYPQETIPLAIEKKYGKGRIIMVNLQGYLDSIFRSPEKLFQSLAIVPSLIGLESDVNKTQELQTKKQTPITRFIGNFDATGKVAINSSSFSLIDKYSNPGRSFTGDIFFSEDKNGDSKKELTEQISEGASIKDLRLVGPYEVSIGSNGIFHMPSRPSDYDYVAFAVVLPLDINIELYNGSSAEIFLENSTNYLRSNGYSEVRIHNVRSGDEGFMEVLMKSPNVKVTDGKSKFSRLYSDDPMVEQLGEEAGFSEVRPDFSGMETEVVGGLSFNFDHVDSYSSSYRNGTTLMYISYLKTLKIDRGSVVVQDTYQFKIPGDLSQLAKERGMYIPLQGILVSDMNILLVILISITVIVVTKLSGVLNLSNLGRRHDKVRVK
jgi:hypothetical protein